MTEKAENRVTPSRRVNEVFMDLSSLRRKLEYLRERYASELATFKDGEITDDGVAELKEMLSREIGASGLESNTAADLEAVVRHFGELEKILAATITEYEAERGVYTRGVI